MAKLMGKKWYDTLEWSAKRDGDTVTIFGHHFPNVIAIQTYREVTSDNVSIRWKNHNDDTIHEFVLEPDWTYDDPTTQIQALLVAIKLS